jgi:hypothetical protein
VTGFVSPSLADFNDRDQLFIIRPPLTICQIDGEKEHSSSRWVAIGHRQNDKVGITAIQ